MGLAPALTDLVATMWPEGRWKYAGAAAALGEVRGDTGGPDPVEPADGRCGTRWRLSGQVQQFTDTDGRCSLNTTLIHHMPPHPRTARHPASHAPAPSAGDESSRPAAEPYPVPGSAPASGPLPVEPEPTFFHQRLGRRPSHTQT